MKLNQLYDVTNAATQESGEQKQAVQRIVSDISHQLKTPIANIKMYADTVTNPQVPEEKRLFFLDGQMCIRDRDKRSQYLGDGRCRRRTAVYLCFIR